MKTIQIVTDSAAHFPNPHFVQQHGITVVPNRIVIGGKVYREGVDLSAEEALRLIAASGPQTQPPAVQSPTETDYLEAFTRLSRHADAIISIQSSREIFDSWATARRAAQQLAGHCKIVVIDSQTLSAGQAMLVRVATRAIEEQATLDDMVRVIRGAAERTYSMFHVETMTYLVQNGIMSASTTILGSMLGIKPFLTIEEGQLKATEKGKTRIQAVERLVEFASEFEYIEDAVILQHKAYISENTRMLQDRLAMEFPDRHFPYALYGPSLAALIGPDASGLVVLESEMPVDDEDF